MTVWSFTQTAVHPNRRGHGVGQVHALGHEEAVETVIPNMPPQENPQNADALKILLVEDSEDNRLLVQLYLGKTQHQLDMAENGEVAVSMFKKNDYQLVLMDMQMPVMDGYTATQKIRQWEERHNRPQTPIIALTSHALKGDMEKCLAAGCSEYMSKPIIKSKLLGTLQNYSRTEPKRGRNQVVL